jgi:molybdate transport system substrate-binding protein
MRSCLACIVALATVAIAPSIYAADLIVSAAASLSNAFTDVGKDFEKANPGTRVLFNFGASGQLVQQIARGAPASVFASADTETMDRAANQRLIVNDTRLDFASNQLVLIVPPNASVQVASMSDLQGAQVRRIGLGTPESVPAGRYAKDTLELANLWDKLTDKYVYGQNVRQVLDYVARGEVDAGFVYATDAALMKDRVRVVLNAPTRRPIVYPIAAVRGSGNESLARRFVDYVASEAGRTVMSRYGFGKP